VSALFAILVVILALAAVVVVTTRDPLRQAMNAGLFGLCLLTLLYAYQAPDVALSAIVVQAVALPLMVLLAVAKTRRQPR
jgi:energy-converting hydrogenase B subunit D